MTGNKVRLDQLLVERGLAPNRQRARSIIMAGKIIVGHDRIDKPGKQISAGATLAMKGEDIPYVSRGGLKLEAALNHYQVTVEDKVCMDVGASTGGFTDCLLQRGAVRVYAVDVGYGQLAWKIRNDSRVIVIERTNIRYMDPEIIPEPVDIITIDVSFISLKIVVPAITGFLKKNGSIVTLIKPQFEVGKGQVGKGGIVKDIHIHQKIIDDLKLFFASIGLSGSAPVPSPVHGAKGNKEYLVQLYFEKFRT